MLIASPLVSLLVSPLDGGLHVAPLFFFSLPVASALEPPRGDPRRLHLPSALRASRGGDRGRPSARDQVQRRAGMDEPGGGRGLAKDRSAPRSRGRCRSALLSQGGGR